MFSFTSDVTQNQPGYIMYPRMDHTHISFAVFWNDMCCVYAVLGQLQSLFDKDWRHHPPPNPQTQRGTWMMTKLVIFPTEGRTLTR